MSKIVTKTKKCKYKKTCSFRNAVSCKSKYNGDPAECTIYQLIEDVQKLKNKIKN